MCVFLSFLCVYMYVGSMGTRIYMCVCICFYVCVYMFNVMGYIGRYSQISTPPEHNKTAPNSINHPILMQTATGLFQPLFTPVRLTKFGFLCEHLSGLEYQNYVSLASSLKQVNRFRLLLFLKPFLKTFIRSSLSFFESFSTLFRALFQSM